MRYTVLWTPTAEQDLAAIWIEAEDRSAIVSATHALDKALRENAEEQGESRGESVRIMFRMPLGIHFEVHPQDRLVFVLAVWKLPSRK